MSGEEPEQRHSRAAEAQLVSDPLQLAEAEALNGLRQYDYGIQVIQSALDRKAFRLRPSLILAVQREALRGISAYAGNFRPAGVQIESSKHTPAGAHLVPELVEDLCDYVNERWSTATPIHLAAYVMWRLNWIHPFSDGTGRTSRMMSYIVLCIRLERSCRDIRQFLSRSSPTAARTFRLSTPPMPPTARAVWT